MKVIVDTPIWSYALRSENERYLAYIHEFETLITDQRVILLGPVRQEVLSGYSDESKFKRLYDKLRYFKDTPIIDDDYVQAAKFSNVCRINGIQGSHIDFMICAVAHRLGCEIFTTDKDFTHYKKHIPIQLFEV